MGTPLTKTISFPKGYIEEYEYLDKMKNSSEYMRELVRKDRIEKENERKKKENDPELLAKQVEELLLKIEELKQK